MDFTDPEQTAAWLQEKLAQAAELQSWGDAVAEELRADINDALTAAGDATWLYGYDADTFYATLVDKARGWTWPGAEKAVLVVQSAAATAGAKEEEAELASLYTQITGTLAGTAEDVGEIGSAAGETATKAVSLLKYPITWVVIGIGVLWFANMKADKFVRIAASR